MFYRKEGIPEEGEIIIGTVKKITSHSIFVNLDEYNNKEGMIHISEVAPGRIRNIRDFVREEKKVVCKVLRIHQDKEHIDLSLRRAPLGLRKKKEEEYKLEQKAEKVLELLAKDLKISLEDLYKKAGYQIIDEFGSLNSFFKEVFINEKESVENLKIDKNILHALLNKIKEKIKQPEISIETILNITTKDPDGIEKIKKSLRKTIEFAKQKNYNASISYISAPRYKLMIKHHDYKTGEKILQEITQFLMDLSKSENLETQWQKKS